MQMGKVVRPIQPFEAVSTLPDSISITCLNKITGLFRVIHEDASDSLKSSTVIFLSMSVYGDIYGGLQVNVNVTDLFKMSLSMSFVIFFSF